MYEAMPSVNHWGAFVVAARMKLPPKRISNWKTCVSSWAISCWSFSSVMSIGSTIRLRDGSANAPTPSGMKFRIVFVCSKSAWDA